MNGIFSFLFLLSAIFFLFTAPSDFLPALMRGAEKAATLSVSLLFVYCVWLGWFAVLEKSGLSQKFSKLLFPLTKRLFRSKNAEALSCACGNISANLLGLPGAPTPLGIRATEGFLQKGETYAAEMLFILNATSLQLFPTTVIALRSSLNSTAPADIVLPTIICSAVSSCLGAVLLAVIRKRK